MNFMRPLRKYQREQRWKARAARHRGLALLALAGVVAASCNEQAAALLTPVPPTPDEAVSLPTPSAPPAPVVVAPAVERDERLCTQIDVVSPKAVVLADNFEASVQMRLSRTSRGLVYPDAQVTFWGSPANAETSDPADHRYYVQPELEVVSFEENRVNGRYEGRLVVKVTPVSEFVCRHVAFRAGEGSRREAYAAWNGLKVRDLSLRLNYSRKFSARTQSSDRGRRFEIVYASERSVRDDVAYLNVDYDARFESKRDLSVTMPVGLRLEKFRERN